MSVTRLNEFQAAKGKGQALYDFLKSLIPYIQNSNGCLSCEVLRNQENPDVFIVIEKWENIESHKKSVENFPKEDMHSAMSLFGGPPKGDYYA